MFSVKNFHTLTTDYEPRSLAFNSDLISDIESSVQLHKEKSFQTQKRTFTKWVNNHLKKIRREIFDLVEDISRNDNLIALLEVLTGEKLKKELAIGSIQVLCNIQSALEFLDEKNIKLINVRAGDIRDGNRNTVMGLIWTLILHFHVSIGKSDNREVKKYLLGWAKNTTKNFGDLKLQDLSKSWRDGLVFSAIMASNRPDLLDFEVAKRKTPKERLRDLFYIAEEEYGVARLLEPEDVFVKSPDELSLITYIASLHNIFPNPPDVQQNNKELEELILEYKKIAVKLQMWITQGQNDLEFTPLPKDLKELKDLRLKIDNFHFHELPDKEITKNHCKNIYKALEKLGVCPNVAKSFTIENLELEFAKLIQITQEKHNLVTKKIREFECKPEKKPQEPNNPSNPVNPQFTNLLNLINWCKFKIKEIKNYKFSLDVQEISRSIQDLQLDKKIVQQFSNKIKLANDFLLTSKFKNMESYRHQLDILKVNYDVLTILSSQKLEDFESLNFFLLQIEVELHWLREKQDIELKRDWSDPKINTQHIETYLEQISGTEETQGDLQIRIPQFKAIVELGKSLLLQNHPAQDIIKSKLKDLHDLIRWLQIFLKCSQVHLNNAKYYQQFYRDLNAAKEWIKEKDELVAKKWTQDTVPIETVARFLRQETELRRKLEGIEMLGKRAAKVAPLKLRRKFLSQPLDVVALCDSEYTKESEHYQLLDNKQQNWLLKNCKGYEFSLASICFLISGSDLETQNEVQNVVVQCDGAVIDMLKKMLANIFKTIKNWDFETFKDLGVQQREDYRRAVQTLFDKLKEEKITKSELSKITQEMAEINSLLFDHQAENLSQALIRARKQLNKNTSQMDLRITKLKKSNKAFEDLLQKLKEEIEQFQELYKSLKPTKAQKQKLELILRRWNEIWDVQNINLERVNCLKALVLEIDKFSQVVSEAEKKLEDPKQISLEEIEMVGVKVNAEMVIVEELTSKITKIPDLEVQKLRKEVQKLNKRWGDVKSKMVAIDKEATKEKIRNSISNCFVRVLRSKVVVRVGGGWMAVEEFIQKRHPEEAKDRIAELIPQIVDIRKNNDTGKAFKMQIGTAIKSKIS